MSEEAGGAGTDASADVGARHLSWVWLIPIGSVLVGAWLLWSSAVRKGPLIKIAFDTAESLQAGQSPVKFKDIQMGTVESFDLTPDRRKVEVNVRMTSKADGLVTQGAQFWVVKPRLFSGEISGLNTLVSGSYVAMEPGGSGKPAQSEFNGLEDPPTVETGEAGRKFLLSTARIGALSVGSPLFFHDVEIGKVLGWKLVGMARSVAVSIFVHAPYDRWVHDDTRFWNTSGLALKLDADGIRLHVASLKAARLGGITLETPAQDEQGAQSRDGHVFELYQDQQMASSATAANRVALASYFTGSVGGLAVGAPVTLQGAPVGNVTSVELQYDTDTNQPRVRAGYTVKVGQVAIVGSHPAPTSEERWNGLVSHGLRAKLVGGNLITGQKEIELQVESDVPAAATGREGGVIVIPPNSDEGGGLDELSGKAGKLLAKIGRMPFEQIGQNLNATLHGASAVVNGEQLRQALTRLNSTLAAAQDTVRHLDTGAAPMLRRLPAIAADLQDTLAQVRGLASSVAAGSGGDTKFARDLDAVLSQVADAAQSVQMVASLLARHPESLIRGRTVKAAR